MEVIECPLCDSANYEVLVPSYKHDYVNGGFYIHEKMNICLCTNCSLMYESPKMPVELYEEYSDKHYYSDKRGNPAEHHDQRQRGLCEYRWSVLEDRLPWDSFSKVADVGATGAWSSYLKERYPAIESVLVEPSSDAVTLCRRRYPKVTAVQETFEAFEDQDESYDCIFMFYSVYMFPDPLAMMRKAWRLLKPGGNFVVVISHVLMETRIWECYPFVDMAHLVRPAPVVYFSRYTLECSLQQAGFHPTDSSVNQHWDSLPQRGRQDYVVVAEKRDLLHSAIEPVGMEEVERTKQLVLNYCDCITEKSMKLFAERQGLGIKKISILHSDKEFFEYLSEKLRQFFVEIPIEGLFVEALDIQPDIAIADEEGHFVCGATLQAIDYGSLQSKLTQARVLDCFVPSDTANVYGYWIQRSDGSRIPAKAFCPVMDVGEDIFPFHSKPVNDFEHLEESPQSSKLSAGLFLKRLLYLIHGCWK